MCFLVLRVFQRLPLKWSQCFLTDSGPVLCFEGRLLTAVFFNAHCPGDWLCNVFDFVPTGRVLISAIPQMSYLLNHFPHFHHVCFCLCFSHFLSLFLEFWQYTTFINDIFLALFTDRMRKLQVTYFHTLNMFRIDALQMSLNMNTGHCQTPDWTSHLPNWTSHSTFQSS